MPAPAGLVGEPSGPNQVCCPAHGSFSFSEWAVNGNDTVGPLLNPSSRKHAGRASPQPATLTKLQPKSRAVHSRPPLGSTVAWTFYAAVRVVVGSTG